MASASTLNDRILRAVASCRVQGDVPARVITAIAETHVIVPKELAERATKAGKTGGNAAWERSSIVGSLAGYYNDPIRHAGDADVSSRRVVCPTCKQGTIAESRPGKLSTIIRAAERVWMSQDQPTVVLIRCPECGGAIEWKGKRLLLVDA